MSSVPSRLPAKGRFSALRTANPTIGQAGRRETVAESRLEIVCSAARLAAALAAIRKTHLWNRRSTFIRFRKPAGPGVGRVGRLDVAIGLDEFAAKSR